MALTPAEPNRDTLRDLLPIFMWDDEKPKPIGAIDHDGWGYIYYGPEYNYLAATNGTAFNFAQAADNFIHNAQAANAATAPTNNYSHGFNSFLCQYGKSLCVYKWSSICQLA